MRKLADCNGKQKCRTAVWCGNLAADQLFFATYIYIERSLYFLNPKVQASSYFCTAWFLSDQAGNPKGRFFGDAAHLNAHWGNFNLAAVHRVTDWLELNLACIQTQKNIKCVFDDI